MDNADVRTHGMPPWWKASWYLASGGLAPPSTIFRGVITNLKNRSGFTASRHVHASYGNCRHGHCSNCMHGDQEANMRYTVTSTLGTISGMFTMRSIFSWLSSPVLKPSAYASLPGMTPLVRCILAGVLQQYMQHDPSPTRGASKVKAVTGMSWPLEWSPTRLISLNAMSYAEREAKAPPKLCPATVHACQGFSRVCMAGWCHDTIMACLWW